MGSSTRPAEPGAVLAPVLAAALLAVLGAVVAPTAAAAQNGEGSRPTGWRILTDEFGADTTGITFVAMDPGFHLTTDPAAIYYDPDMTARGSFRAETTIHLFEPGEGNEAFGLFVGGDDLEGSYQGYTYFLLRPTGEYLIGRRLSYTSSETLVDWTAHEAVTAWGERSEGAQTVENTLGIEARDSEVVFLVNGEEVARIERTRQGADGIVGLRAEPGLDLHVTELEVSPL